VTGLLFAGLTVLLLVPTSATAQMLEGGWQLERYEGGGSTGPAEGLLLLADGHFALTYTMQEDGRPSAGRAHAGRYDIKGNTLTFRVQWNIEHVSGKASVSQRPAERAIRFTLRGEELILHFENGAIQQFRRVRER
jgi:hypothetical protein